MAARRRNAGDERDEPGGPALHELLKGRDFEKRELIHKPKGAGLFDLVRERDGRYRCYACTLCERTCPVDCIEMDFCPEFEQLPFDLEAERSASWAGQLEVDMKRFDGVVARIREGSGLVEALHATQETYGYLPHRALEEVAGEMDLPVSRVVGVASFYPRFRLEPVGRHVIDVCVGTACHLAGAPLVVEALTRELEIPVGETTTDGLFTLRTVTCLGACSLAPVVCVGDDETLGRVGPNEVRTLVRTLRRREAVS